MKRISVREFCKRPKSYLSSLPLTLTIYKKKVAVIVKSADTLKVERGNVPTQSRAIKLCKHGQAMGLCKYGCK